MKRELWAGFHSCFLDCILPHATALNYFVVFFNFSKTQTEAHCDPKEGWQQCSADCSLPTPFIHPKKV